MRNLGLILLLRARDHLEQRFVDGEDTRGAGLGFELAERRPAVLRRRDRLPGRRHLHRGQRARLPTLGALLPRRPRPGAARVTHQAIAPLPDGYRVVLLAGHDGWGRRRDRFWDARGCDARQRGRAARARGAVRGHRPRRRAGGRVHGVPAAQPPAAHDLLVPADVRGRRSPQGQPGLPAAAGLPRPPARAARVRARTAARPGRWSRSSTAACAATWSNATWRSDFTFVGQNMGGDHMRVHYFPGRGGRRSRDPGHGLDHRAARRGQDHAGRRRGRDLGARGRPGGGVRRRRAAARPQPGPGLLPRGPGDPGGAGRGAGRGGRGGGGFAVVALVSPYREDREAVRLAHARRGLGFLEVWVDTPLAECEARDPKGLYARARAGELSGLTGMDAPVRAAGGRRGRDRPRPHPRPGRARRRLRARVQSGAHEARVHRRRPGVGRAGAARRAGAVARLEALGAARPRAAGGRARPAPGQPRAGTAADWPPATPTARWPAACAQAFAGRAGRAHHPRHAARALPARGLARRDVRLPAPRPRRGGAGGAGAVAVGARP